ncbi:MAG: methyltransferase [Bacteroidota bacterium]
MPFRFKQFVVDDAACPMKVGTDSVLLGAWAKLENSLSILDIGTGCGLLALMAAQRSEALITAIDIDPVANGSAAANFRISPWAGRLTARCIRVQDFQNETEAGNFDHIISNPPFFINSLKAPDPERSNARHNDLLPIEDLVKAVVKLLSPEGRFSLILPVQESIVFTDLANVAGLFLVSVITVIPKTGKEANRMLLEFGMQQMNVETSALTIRDASGEFTTEYKKLTRDFYLNF